ncbi:Glucose-6-phosphate/phosphate and phosphoenolpyruvate/phosphate antiporter domain-containing protein [Dioscorea alata]|uniref:Glucose-6-phosphate/phosphate and phosphoenolpyruvate/phosphate antiporter domain-containing protein n=2 Tax=Dioscorea alata TaxID=55571 RepID=A0ACB7VIG4_DIOAL|nr:Glucose-6-phosphate/phosphate and phosphoenolpyruvate/phosphate antiporter domain-containing protein [Dioscorea alata]KAH7673971.1 Glucose-6-phosphate/phosphate and phosphoenolpyruvate/phosphate antiporter domain-containing protein [Dioscorea alata]
MAERKSGAVSDAGVWAMNIISSVGIIMANKQVMSPAGYAFSFATFLTGLHFLVTSLVGYVPKALGISSSSQNVPLQDLIFFSIVANVSITAMNLSLMLNTVGFYQIAKLSIAPVVCVMEMIFRDKHFSREVKMSVVIVVLGVGICTVTDVRVNAQGFICACVAVAATAWQQIRIEYFQEKYSISSFELLSKTAPIQAISLLIFGPFIDYYLNHVNLLNYKASVGAVLFILLSCTLAVFCNVSQYMCIGRFSAVSFQVLGHMKTVCVLILGWVLFDSQLTFKNILGMAMAVIGMVLYSWARQLEKQAKESVTKTSMTEEEIRLLMESMESGPVKDVELAQPKVQP